MKVYDVNWGGWITSPVWQSVWVVSLGVLSGLVTSYMLIQFTAVSVGLVILACGGVSVLLLILLNQIFMRVNSKDINSPFNK